MSHQWATRHVSLERLWSMRDEFLADQVIRETFGETKFALVSQKMVELIDNELWARGEMPIGMIETE